MTVIPFDPRQNLVLGARAGTCDICGRLTGSLSKHRPACARRSGRLPLATPVTMTEEALILRAGTHAMHQHLLSPQARLQGGVSDLHVARLIHHLEKGGSVLPSPSWRSWVLEGADEKKLWRKPSITRVVQECLRLGLVRTATELTAPSVYRTQVVPALTHARSGTDHTRPACRAYDPHTLRWRLLDRDHLMYVDCQACLDVPLSCLPCVN